MTYTRDDVGPRTVNGVSVDLTDEEKDAIVARWNSVAPMKVRPVLPGNTPVTVQMLRDLGLIS